MREIDASELKIPDFQAECFSMRAEDAVDLFDLLTLGKEGHFKCWSIQGEDHITISTENTGSYMSPEDIGALWAYVARHGLR